MSMSVSFLRLALNAALPGIDVNDSSKTCATFEILLCSGHEFTEISRCG